MSNGFSSTSLDAQHLLHLLIQLFTRGFPGDSAVSHLPAMQKTRVQSLGREVPLEKEMTTHSSLLAWEIACTTTTDHMGLQRVRYDLATKQQQISKTL